VVEPNKGNLPQVYLLASFSVPFDIGRCVNPFFVPRNPLISTLHLALPDAMVSMFAAHSKWCALFLD
jgi:hypothetical protein